MRSRYKIIESDGVYFVTSTVVEWIPIFIGSDICSILTDSLGFCRKQKQLKVYAYVVMENHIHLVAEAPDLSNVMQAFKRHTVREIIAHCETKKQLWLLHQLKHFRKSYKTTSTYQLWQEGFHPQLIESDEVMFQKIDYIHQNPLRRGYVDAPEHWRYSSARNYATGWPRVMEIDTLPRGQRTQSSAFGPGAFPSTTWERGVGGVET